MRATAAILRYGFAYAAFLLPYASSILRDHSDSDPEVISRALTGIESNWLGQAELALNQSSSDLTALQAVQHSCMSIVRSIVQGGEGDKIRVATYMRDVCAHAPTNNSARVLCDELGSGITALMSPSEEYNKRLHIAEFCDGFYQETLLRVAVESRSWKSPGIKRRALFDARVRAREGAEALARNASTNGRNASKQNLANLLSLTKRFEQQGPASKLNPKVHKRVPEAPATAVGNRTLKFKKQLRRHMGDLVKALHESSKRTETESDLKKKAKDDAMNRALASAKKLEDAKAKEKDHREELQAKAKKLVEQAADKEKKRLAKEQQKADELRGTKPRTKREEIEQAERKARADAHKKMLEYRAKHPRRSKKAGNAPIAAVNTSSSGVSMTKGLPLEPHGVDNELVKASTRHSHVVDSDSHLGSQGTNTARASRTAPVKLDVSEWWSQNIQRHPHSSDHSAAVTGYPSPMLMAIAILGTLLAATTRA